MKDIKVLFFCIIVIFNNVCLKAFAQDYKQIISTIDEKTRLDEYQESLEHYLIDYLVNEYDHRAELLWDRDYSSADALQRSVEPNRNRWRDRVIKPPLLRKTGGIIKTPYDLGDDLQGSWVKLPLGSISAEGILILPKGASKDNPVPLIIVQHGAGSSPERPFEEDGESYFAYAKSLVNAGFAVLSPLNLRGIPRRNTVERYTRLADLSLPGIEFARLQHLLDAILEDKSIDDQRIGMWGVSLGGMATMFWMPLEPRIKTGVVSAWFNNRNNKMVIEDPRWSSFAKYGEEYAFLTGWLTEFSDRDLISMICPRPIQVQHGKKDNIAYWPDVVEEFKKSKVHYEKLGLEKELELILHEGGHEAKVEEGVRFLKKTLMQ